MTAGQAFGTSVSVDANTNRINSAGYAYDAAGNMINDTNHSYAFDAENRITSVDGTVATYTYLGALRVKKVTSTATTVYVYSGTKPIAEYVGGTLSKEYVYAGSGTMLATVAAGGAVTYEHPDHLSIRAESDASGNLIRSTGHFPFGEQWYDTSPGSKWQFTSYERDSESGLDYATFRSYSSRLARFMSPDPLQGSQSDPELLDRYSYVRNNPENAVDPLGLWQMCFEHGIATYDDKGNMIAFEYEYTWCITDQVPGQGFGFTLLVAPPDGSSGDPQDPKAKEKKDACAKAQADFNKTFKEGNDFDRQMLKDLRRDMFWGGVIGCGLGAVGTEAVAPVVGTPLAVGDCAVGAIGGGLTAWGVFTLGHMGDVLRDGANGVHSVEALNKVIQACN